jgi:hypothetical protein
LVKGNDIVQHLRLGLKKMHSFYSPPPEILRPPYHDDIQKEDHGEERPICVIRASPSSM